MVHLAASGSRVIGELARRLKRQLTESRLRHGVRLIVWSGRDGVLWMRLGAPFVIPESSAFVFEVVHGFFEGIGKLDSPQRAR